MNKRVEIGCIFVLYMFTLYLWTLPFQDNKLPYGEVDAGSHFTLGDYMGQNDKPIWLLPYYIDLRYGEDNSFIHHTLWYPPPYHTNLAIMQIIGGDRIVPIYLLVAILSSFIVLISYFVIRRLYGFWPAFLSSLLLVFSMRDILNFLWGQWPERISYYIVPLVLYTFYKYCYSCIDKEKKVGYLYLTAGLLAVSLLLHPTGFMYAAATLSVFFIVFFIKERKWIFDLKELACAALILLLIVSVFPVQFGNVIVRMNEKNPGVNKYAPFSSLFHWSKDPADYVGAMPAAYFSYSEMHGIWTMPLLILGLIILLVRRKRQDIFLLSWLIAVYIMIHLDFIGKGDFSHRSLSASAHIFSPIIAIGLLSIPSFLSSINKKFSTIIKYAFILIFIVLVIMLNGKPAYSQLKDAYQGPMRLTQPQYEAALWMKDNLDIYADIEDFGTLNLAKKRWIQYVSQRHINHINNFDENITSDYVLLDYSDPYILKDYSGFPQQIEDMKKLEANLTGASLVYDKNYIRVYKIG